MNDRNPALPTGFLLEQYEVRSVIAQSDVGVEYLAFDRDACVDVEIQEFLPTSLVVRASSGEVRSIREDEASRFDAVLEEYLYEAQTLTQVRHPNVLRLRETLRCNGTGYVVAKHLPGSATLEFLLDHEGMLAGEIVKSMVPPLLAALDELHQVRLLHLDIRPEMISMRQDGTPILRAFGAVPQRLGGARQSFGDTRWKRHVATQLTAYAPIELYSQASKPGPWSDIYSLGATLYHCITGKTPPPATDRVVQDTLEMPSGKAAAGIDSSMLAAITAALGIIPTERPRSIALWKDKFSTSSTSAPKQAAGARFARASARGGRISAGRRPKAARTQRRTPKWSIPALALTTATAAIAYVDIGVLRSVDDTTGQEPSLVHLAMAGRTEAVNTGRIPEEMRAREYGRADAPYAPAAAGAILVVDTEPADVEVLVAGQYMGHTPLRLSGLPVGIRNVTLQHPYYESVELRDQRFAASRELRISTTLERATGNLLITTDPPGAWVAMNDERLLERTPGTLQNLPAGPVELQLGAPGRHIARVVAEVPRGSTGYIAQILPVAYGTLRLDVVPGDAQVVVAADPETRYSYRSGMRLPRGSYSIEVSRQGYSPQTRDVEVDGDTNLLVELVPAPRSS